MAKGGLSGWSKMRVGVKCYPESNGEEVGEGAASRDKLRKGADLPLSCASWPAVKSASLPVSAGRPTGRHCARVRGSDRDRESGGQRFE